MYAVAFTVFARGPNLAECGIGIKERLVRKINELVCIRVLEKWF